MKLNRNGNSLIQVVVAAGIMAMIAMAAASMISDQNKQIKAMSEKIATQDISGALKNVLANPDFCSCLLRNKTLNSLATPPVWNSDPASIPVSYTAVPAFPASCTAASTDIVPAVSSLVPGTSMTVSHLKVSDISEIVPGSGKYTGNLEVGFSNAIRVLRNIKSPILFSVNTSDPAIARSFMSCTPVGGAAAGFQVGRLDVVACHNNTCCYDVTFPTALGAPPTAIFMTPYHTDYGSTNGAITFGFESPTTTGFRACFDHIGMPIDNNFYFHWMAVGN